MRYGALILCLAASAFGQIGLDGITASVSRTVSVAPDEASVAILLTTDQSVSRDQVAEILRTAGFGSSTLVAVVAGQNGYQYPPGEETTVVSYQFGLTVAATDLKELNQKLETFRKARPDAVQAIRFQTTLRASDAAIDDARQKMLPQLLADAKKRAGALATAAGLKLGAIQSLSDSAYSNGVATPWLGSYGMITSSSGYDNGGPQVTFSMFVKFAAN